MDSSIVMCLFSNAFLPCNGPQPNGRFPQTYLALPTLSP
jgi:hypothetical protein